MTRETMSEESKQSQEVEAREVEVEEADPFDALYNSRQFARVSAVAEEGVIFDIPLEQKALVALEEFPEKPKSGERLEIYIEEKHKGYWRASLHKAEGLKLYEHYERLAKQEAVVEGKLSPQTMVVLSLIWAYGFCPLAARLTSSGSKILRTSSVVQRSSRSSSLISETQTWSSVDAPSSKRGVLN